MSERERWIVYPLVFLALGAAIRDKVLHEVETDELRCKRLVCDKIVTNDIVSTDVVSETMSVIDPQQSNRILAQIGVATMPGDKGQPRRVGRLLLTDGAGTEIFGLADDFLQMRNIRCESVTITDPQNPQLVLAKLGYAQMRAKQADSQPHRVGVLALNNQQVFNVFGLPSGGPQAEVDPAAPDE